MAGLGRLVIDLDARIARFERAMARAERITQQRMRRIKGVATKVAGGIGAILGTALGAGLLRGSKQAADALTNIADQADKLGLTTDKLQTLRFAAEQAGVSVKSFDVGFQRFTRRVADAAAGNKKLAETFEQFNISLTDGEGRLKSNVDVFYEFADAIEASDDQGKRILKTFQLFDTEGVDLVRILQQGSDAIKQFEMQAKSMGAVVNGQVIKEARDASNQLAAMSRVVSAITTPAMAALAPVMVDLAKAFAFAANAAAKFFDFFRDTSQKQNVEGLRARLTELNEEAVKVGNELQKRLSAGGAGRNVAGLKKRFASLREEIDATITRLRELESGRAAGAAVDLGGLPDPEKAKETKAVFRDISQEMIRQGEILNAQIKGTEKKLQIDMAIADAAERLGRNLTNFEKQFIESELKKQQEYERILDLRAEKTKESFDRIEQFGKQAMANIQDAMATFLFDPFDDGLNGMLRGFTDTIRKMVAQIAAEKLLAQVTSLFGGSEFFGNLAGLFQGPRKLAAGGNVASGESVIVGERGPELFTPSTAGTVSPMSQGVTVNVNVSGDNMAATGRTAAQIGYDVGRGFNLAQIRNG